VISGPYSVSATEKSTIKPKQHGRFTMFKTKIFALVFGAFLISITACDTDNNMTNPMSPDANASEDATGLMKGNPIVPNAIWAHGDSYATLITNATFKPGQGNFDNLYNIPLDETTVRHISESAPGDMDYNGGRWHVFVYTGNNPNEYAEATSVEDLDLDDFTATETYFECPMLPRK
jgi:hypothetical protein